MLDCIPTYRTRRTHAAPPDKEKRKLSFPRRSFPKPHGLGERRCDGSEVSCILSGKKRWSYECKGRGQITLDIRSTPVAKVHQPIVFLVVFFMRNPSPRAQQCFGSGRSQYTESLAASLMIMCECRHALDLIYHQGI